MSMYEQYGAGYPSEPELQAIREFHGTPRAFVEYIGSIWRNGAGWSLELVQDDIWETRQEWLATFVTGGWSGCEEIIGVVSETFFSWTFHSKWERGGLWEYRINPGLIDSELDLGAFPKPASHNARP